MCLIYKDIPYEYAFEFKIPVDYSPLDRIFRIVASNIIEETQNYAGLCLENELMVVSDEDMPFGAFFDIVNEIVEITISSEKSYSEAHNGKIPVPHRKVTDPAFLAKFEERKNSKSSQYYYKQLKTYFERPEHITESISDEVKPDLWEYLNVLFFMFLLNKKLPYIKDVRFFKI